MQLIGKEMHSTFLLDLMNVIIVCLFKGNFIEYATFSLGPHQIIEFFVLFVFFLYLYIIYKLKNVLWTEFIKP